MTVDPLTFLLLAAVAPLSLDILTHIVNVQWDDGLAVEFFKGANGETPTA